MASVAVCSIEWCEKPARTKGWCGGHYARHLRGQDMDAPMRAYRPTGPMPMCSVGGCEYQADCRLPDATCASHRNIFRRSGSYNKVRMDHTRKPKTCMITGCTERAKSRMACTSHNTRCTMYRLTVIQLDAILSKGICELCGKDSQKISIDHDHACCPGERSCGNCVRGGICAPCNLGLGAFRDSQESLTLAIEYLKRNSAPMV